MWQINRPATLGNTDNVMETDGLNRWKKLRISEEWGIKERSNTKISSHVIAHQHDQERLGSPMYNTPLPPVMKFGGQYRWNKVPNSESPHC